MATPRASPLPPDAPRSPGRDGPPRIGQYEVLFELAQGGMGTVHLGRATGAQAGAARFERLVAIKRLHAHLLVDPESVRRFLEEATVAARVHHANVVGVHQVGRDEGGHFLVQDYVEGDTLEGLIDAAILRRARLPPPIVLRIAIDALAGLHAVHEARGADGGPLGIVHRDVSTQNLLVGRDGVTRLADFGIAKHAQSSVVTDARYLQGRVLYMPPEYLARRPVDRRFDLYGLGITLWIALSGGPPWPDAGDAQIVHLATTEGIPALSAGGLAIAPPIEALIARACAMDPAQRFATAQEMLEAIEALGRDTGWIASHAEVAALVEASIGRELTARRAAVSRALDAGASTSASASATTPDVALSVAELQVVPPPPRWGAFAAAAAIAALLAISVGWIASRGGARPAIDPAHAAMASAPLPSTSTLTPAPSASAAPPTSAAPSALAASATLASARLTGQRAGALAPTATAIVSATPRGATPTDAPTVASAAPTVASPLASPTPPIATAAGGEPPAPPATIGTANPYH